MLNKYHIFAGSDASQDQKPQESKVEPSVTAEPKPQEPNATTPSATEPKPQEPPKTGMSDDMAKLLKEVMKKKDDLRVAQNKIDELEKIKAAIDGLGGLDKLSKMIQDENDRQKKALEDKGEWDKLKKQMSEDHAKAMADINKKVADLTKENEASKQKIVELTIGAAFNNSKFIAEKLTLTPAKARVIYSDYFDLVEDGVVGYDKPRGKAGRTQLVDQFGNPLPFDSAIEKIIEKDPDVDSLLRSKAKSGAGSYTKTPTGVQLKQTEVHGVDKIMAGLSSLKK